MIRKIIRTNLEEGFFYFQLHNIFIKSKINRVTGTKSITKYVMLEFENGHLDIHQKSIIEKIDRPPNILLDFDWCYRIENAYGEFLGYIGKPNKNIKNEVSKCQ